MEEETKVSIKEYFESRLTSLDDARKTALQAMEKRLEGMNEFREQLREQTSKFITRDEYLTGHKPLEERISAKLDATEYYSFKEATNNTLEDYKINKAVLATKASMNTVIVSYVLAIISIVIGVASFVLRAVGK